MYTTLRLISIGWQISGEETLGMTRVTERFSAWEEIVPEPRMVKNQLGHLLELNTTELDRKILKAVQSLLEQRKQCMWVIGTLAVFPLLHIRELHAGRNIYWRRYKDSVQAYCFFEC